MERVQGEPVHEGVQVRGLLLAMCGWVLGQEPVDDDGAQAD